MFVSFRQGKWHERAQSREFLISIKTQGRCALYKLGVLRRGRNGVGSPTTPVLAANADSSSLCIAAIRYEIRCRCAQLADGSSFAKPVHRRGSTEKPARDLVYTAIVECRNVPACTHPFLQHGSYQPRKSAWQGQNTSPFVPSLPVASVSPLIIDARQYVPAWFMENSNCNYAHTLSPRRMMPPCPVAKYKARRVKWRKIQCAAGRSK